MRSTYDEYSNPWRVCWDKLVAMFIVDSVCLPGMKPISLELGAGECIGISGDSGCGKSRLLRALADMDEHEGRLFLDGVACLDTLAHNWRRQVGLLPAESQWWCDTVAEHFPPQGADLSLLGFGEDTMNWEVSRCSSGEKQRLSLIRLLTNKPRVLLLDEPSANLDPDNTAKLESIVRDYIEQQQACCIWVSHDRQQLSRVADRQYVFIDGMVQPVEAG